MKDGQATVPSKNRTSRSETLISPPPYSGQGDELDFHANVARQPSHLDGGAGRRVRREIAAIDFVHGGGGGQGPLGKPRFFPPGGRRPRGPPDGLLNFSPTPRFSGPLPLP